MKWPKEKRDELTKLCVEGKMSNKELATHFDMAVADIYAARSALGITIDKCKAIKEGKVVPGKRSAEDIKTEIKKVEKSLQQALIKVCRADDRLAELVRELGEARA